MMKLEELLKALDAFVAAPKRLAGTDGPVTWAPGHNSNELRAYFPIEVNGELLEGARLEVVALDGPSNSGIQYRLSLCYNAAIARLDHTDETHPNANRIFSDYVPPSVRGAHYHPWGKNRRFFKGESKAPELHNAEPFETKGSFDSNLRWFCQELNIDQPDGRHVIELPRKERLI